MKLFALLTFLLGTLNLAQAQFGLDAGPTRVQVELVSETSAVVPGQPFYVALKMTHSPGWHTYWTNPGTGMPSKVSWELPEGFEVGPRISPIPEVKEDAIGNTHIFHGTVYHVYQITPPGDFEAETVSLTGKASWLQCEEDRCDPPKSAPIELMLAGGDAEPEVNTETKATIDAVLAQPTRGP